MAEKKLSERQQEIYNLLLKGYTTPEIAKTLYLSTTTVKSHCKVIYAAFGVETRSQLLAQELDSAKTKLEQLAKEYQLDSR